MLAVGGHRVMSTVTVGYQMMMPMATVGYQLTMMPMVAIC